MMVAKFNKLKGGMALTFGFNHLLADASTVAEVERIWSLHTADVSGGRKSTYASTENDAMYRERLSKPTELNKKLESKHTLAGPENNLPQNSNG